MKKLLIIQTDEAYFLFETLKVLELHKDAFKGFDLTLLTNSSSLDGLKDGSVDLSLHISTDPTNVLNTHYDLSVNLSLNESSWVIHEEVQSSKKLGAKYKKELQIEDLWSSHYLTIKNKTPFLTYHLHDYYKNILGIRKKTNLNTPTSPITKIAFGLANTNLLSGTSQAELIEELNRRHPFIKIVDIKELDMISDLSGVLYIGPATLKSLKLSWNGARTLNYSFHFQGFNLLPYGENNFFASSRGEKIVMKDLLYLIENLYFNSKHELTSALSLYQTTHENLEGAFLTCKNTSDNNYPFYQCHVLLWNYILNLYDTQIDVPDCGPSQIQLLKTNLEVLTKLIRLYDYAMSSIGVIYQESRANESNSEKILGHMKNLQEIENASDKLADANSVLRPVIDFYRIRRGQSHGGTLVEQAQHSYLTYTEEHHALKALAELFSVTLQKNGVSI